MLKTISTLKPSRSFLKSLTSYHASLWVI